MSQFRQLILGEPAPWFFQRCTSNPNYAFDTVGGRYIVLCFFGSAGDSMGQAALHWLGKHRPLFDDERFAYFGLSNDPEDERANRLRESLPGVRHFWDFDGKVSRLYGAMPQGPDAPATDLRRLWVVLDPALHVIASVRFQIDGSDQTVISDLLQRLPPVSHYGGVEMHAPVIILPHVFERNLCNELIAEYNTRGGELSGFMTERDGKTVGSYDPNHKRREDCTVTNPRLIDEIQQRVIRKVRPTILKVHNFNATRMERYIVGCYSSETGGHFRQHRDNTTKGTAHRRFAMSVNLNDDFEGGELVFPEYGPRKYKVPGGSAVIFSGSLLHMVCAVTNGRRFAFLPFLYDEAAAALREQNNRHLAEGGGEYKA